MPRTNESQAQSGADRKPDDEVPTNPRAGESGRPDPVSDLAARLEGVKREASSKLEQVRNQVQHDLARTKAKFEEDIAADEAERDLLHDDLKASDIEMLDLLTANSQPK